MGEFPRPALTADAALVRHGDTGWEILLVKRGRPPFLGRWALPGGFVDEYEPPEDAARRELEEETGIRFDGPLALVGVYGGPGRDPRGWTVSVVFAGIADADDLGAATAGDDADDAAWHPLESVPDLAFDHADIVADVRQWLGREQRV
ncbi:MAG: NUDIX hydrolase [Coriobacteriia bacterium]|nr:NUDIX hydrolase [Coriobacteriia bacterium]